MVIAMSETKLVVRYKFIYNPNAGKKRNIIPGSGTITLEEIKLLFKQYQIPVDYYPTRGPGHATELAKNSIKEKYNVVIAAGGDGTIEEVASGLVGSDMVMGIVPLGTFMNIPSALAIPNNIETAVMLIKIGRTRKIDVGQIHTLDGEKLSQPHYFLENAGIGLEAQLQQQFLEMERGDRGSIFKVIKTALNYYAFRATVKLDDQEIEVKSGMVEVSNGPITGANLTMAPKAKLNDHRLTVSIFKMTMWQLLLYFVRMKWGGKAGSRRIQRFSSRLVKITTRRPRLVHADARIFGTTPVVFSVVPNALTVISGFPKPGESALIARTPLDP